MTISVHTIERLLHGGLPARGEGYEVLLATGEPAVWEADDGGVSVRIELRVFEPGERVVRDVKTQEVYFLPAPHRADTERAAAYLGGWTRALPSIVAARGGIDSLLPQDLLFPQALDDAALHTEDDFASALADPARIAAWIDQNTRDEVREGLARWGLEDEVDTFLALRRPAIGLGRHTPVDEGEPLPVGSTRFGGEPDLPPSVEWPTSGGRPMTFAAQLDLEDLSRFPAARELPREGLLSFFYDATPDCDFETTLAYPVRVLHVPSRAGLEGRATPPGGDRRPEYTAEPHPLSDTLPPYESPFYEALLPVEQVVAFRRSLASGPVRDPLPGLPEYLGLWNHDDADDTHRVLGYCKPYQGDPWVDAEVHATGRSWSGWEEGSAGAIAVSRTARRWRLLLQVCAWIDGELLLNQDCGYLYFLLPEDALATHDWTRVWCVLQCS